MKPKKYLEHLKQINTLPKLVKSIKSIFESFEDDNYIPAIIQEGTFTLEQGEDLYLKLVLKHQSLKLEKTWLKNNMAFGLEEPTDHQDNINKSAFAHNVITYRKYKSRNLYQLNPLLVSEEINEYDYSNSNYVNAFLNDEYSNLKGLPVLKSTDDLKLMVLKKVFNDFINDSQSNIYPKFELVAEFEYRTHKGDFKIDNSNQYISKDSFLRVDRNKNAIFILGSIVLPPFKSKKKKNKRNIQVLDLTNLRPREHNYSHYNGDIIEGFICFKSEVMNVLKEHYYFYDLQMVDKNNIENTYLVDVLDDKVVFWEAEYNKLPEFIKDKIDPYNFVPVEKKGVISPAMSAMQLDVDWNWDKKLPPEFTLANLIRERVFKRAIDMGLTFIEPTNEPELKEFILKVESLTGVTLERFNSAFVEVKQLMDIRNGNILEKTVNDLKLLYQKYCYAIQMEYKK